MIVYSENQGRGGTEWRLTARSITSLRSSVQIEKDPSTCPEWFVYNSQNVNEALLKVCMTVRRMRIERLVGRVGLGREEVMCRWYSTLPWYTVAQLTVPNPSGSRVDQYEVKMDRYLDTRVCSPDICHLRMVALQCSAPAE